MPSRRLIRVNELLRREIGNALYRVTANTNVDISAITVTHVITSSDLRSANVLVSIRDNQDNRPQMLALLNRHRVELQAIIGKTVGLKYTPRLSFQLDTSLEEGDHVLGILDKLGDSTDERKTDIQTD